MRWLRLFSAIVVFLVVAAFSYEHIAAWRDSRVLQHVGRPVDVGGRTLNIHCLGEGSPRVIFDSIRRPGTSGRRLSARSPRSPAPAGTTGLRSVGVIPALTRTGAMPPRVIFMSSWGTPA